MPGAEFVAFFGAQLHVSGYDKARLEAALAPYDSNPDFTIRQAAPSLEDVFIQLQKNRQGDAP